MDNFEKQKKLATIIKGIHQELRIKTREVGAEEAWNSHLNDKAKLELYSKSMKELSESHWKQKNTTVLNDRIQWIINFSEHYYQESEFENYRLKDLEILKKIESEGYEIEEYEISALRIDEKLKVLDVGSNGNFFKDYKRFNLTPIDIAPSSIDCYYCDFLTVQISQELKIIESNVISTLPENFYDIVLFCLLLEYLPTSTMRIKCCENAYTLLKTEGILIIITPDSSSQHRNAALIKNWKWTLAMIGFKRIKVEKLKNLYAMVFRKSISKEISIRWAKKYKESYMDFKLEIPQDRNLTNLHTEGSSDEEVIEYDPEIMTEMPLEFE